MAMSRSRHSSDENYSPAPKRQNVVDDSDPAIMIVFDSAQIHQILGQVLPAQRVPYTGAVTLPGPGTGPAASLAAFGAFLDNVGLKVGMTADNFVKDRKGVRELGYFMGVSGHVADLFETELDAYAWGLGANQSGGKIYKVSPSGAASTTVVNKVAGPFR